MTIPCTVKLRQAPARHMQPVMFSFDAAEPFVVRLEVQTSVEGIFAKFNVSRELLANGSGVAAGDLKHRVYPDDGQIVINLTDEKGTITFRALRINIDAFLGQTYQIRPVQADAPSLDVDPSLAAALDAWIEHSLKEAS